MYTSELQPQISIMVPSNRCGQIIKFLDAIESTVATAENIEVLINIDHGDNKMAQLLEQLKLKYKFLIKYIDTFNGGFYDSWIFINDLLKITSNSSYFMIFLSDEMLFKSVAWDETILKYKHYYSDDVFRLRCSELRYHNYFDFWECGFAPDSIAFTTKKWVAVAGGDWASCFSSDAFQQFVSYYLIKSCPFDKYQINRDIPVPFIEFKGEGASIGLSGKKARDRFRGGVIAWKKLISHKMQEDAKSRAMQLRAEIYANKEGLLNYQIINDKNKKHIMLRNENVDIIKFSYKLSKCKIALISFLRNFSYLYFTGGGEEARQRTIRFNLTFYLSARYDSLIYLHEISNHIAGWFCTQINKIKSIPRKIARLFQMFFH